MDGASIMIANRFLRAARGEITPVPPIWMMRQAGRYQRRYQTLRARHSFDEMCRRPELAAAVAMGSIEDFDFDAAILFSDLLFPLEALGFGLSYADGPPKLDGALTQARMDAFRPWRDAAGLLRFQAEAVAATRARLDGSQGLIGFVGGPWTLFVYAVEGSHAGALTTAKASPGLYSRFAAVCVPLLAEAIRMQLEAGADIVMVFDTAAGELSCERFAEFIVPDLARLAAAFPDRVGYYAKASHPDQLAAPAFVAAPWAGVGVDARWSMADLLQTSRHGFVQGNFDPALLLLPEAEFRHALRLYLEPLIALRAEERRGWICSLGHGVLPGTPEAHVRIFVDTIRQAFS